MAINEPVGFLKSLFDTAVRSADPAHCLPPYLSGLEPPQGNGRTIVVGAGKAAAAMARALEDHWSGALEGLVVTRYGHGVVCQSIEVVEASHPVPDGIGVAAAGRILELVTGLTTDDLVICLISGGGSSLLSLPAPGLSLADKQDINRALLKSGATIDEMNCLRKHLSAIKGGRLAQQAAPARLVTLAISDVPGDDPAVIASGPTVPDPTTSSDARAILERYGIEASAAVTAHLARAESESPKPGNAAFARARTQLIATPQVALDAAAKLSRSLGVTPHILGDAIEGEARDVAAEHAAVARDLASGGKSLQAPAVILSGGETTVTLRGQGRGGRNAEFLLALALQLDGLAGVYALACDTDGIDGSEDNAGAVIGPDILQRAAAARLDAAAYLADNNGYEFFEALDALVVTGPTLTNVNDFRAIYIAPGQ